MLHQDGHAQERNRKLSEIGVQTMQHTDIVHVLTTEVETYRAQARQKRISFTELPTLLRLLTKSAFMNGNKRVANSSFTAV